MSLKIPTAPGSGLFKQGYQKFVLPKLPLHLRHVRLNLSLLAFISAPHYLEMKY